MKRVMPICVALVAATALSEAPMPTPEHPSLSEKNLQGVVRTSLDSPQPSPVQVARREKSLAILKQLGVPYLATLPVTENAESISPRGPKELADRTVAVAICSVKGETDDHTLAQKLVAQYEAKGLFSPKEQAFLDDPSPERQQLIDFAWRYEAMHVFLWALGHLEELNPPNLICDVPSEVRIIRELGRDGLATKARPRSMSEILDEADLYYHLHWSVIELRLRGQSSDMLDEGIIRERHRALNWLIRYMKQNWDDVQTDT